MAEVMKTSTSGQKPAIAAVADSKKLLKNDSELYKVNVDTDTVRGQLDNNYANTDTPLMKRYAAQGKQEAISRGLTNSTIAAQGGMANVLDKAGDFAKTDAGFYNDRKTETLRSKTAVKTTQIGADASMYGADRQLEGQLGAARIGASAEVRVAGMNNVAAGERLDKDIAGRLQITEIDAASRERISSMETSTQLSLKQLEERGANSRLSGTTRSQIFSDTAAGINSIDQTASAATQDAQAKRILDFQAIRLTAMEDIDAALGL